jgi:hypothetical protein
MPEHSHATLGFFFLEFLVFFFLHILCLIFHFCYWQMPPPLTFHIGYAGGASRWTQNLTSAAWALYTPLHELLHSSSICLGSTTNNQVEYTTIIGLLSEASSHHIRHLSVLEDSQLIVL